ncbi:MFS transporter [Cystobacter fuscus]|uniref:MFS transporter n=1 Tax=Cystobacter fuscus TaxID=43 RepID=UPI000687CA5A|nr:MFS transporter [Cystobacter fuscus]
MRPFFILWIGQLLSSIGSELTRFAIGVWVYQRTGAVNDFAFISLSLLLPRLLVLPFAGVLVDRWSRRKVMLLADTASALCTLALYGVLTTSGALNLWLINVLVMLGAASGGVHSVAYKASYPLLVPKEQLGRVNGVVQGQYAAAQLIAPLLAGSLLGLAGLETIIAIDMGTFLVAVLTLMTLRIPQPLVQRERKESIWRQLGAGWHELRSRPGLVGLLLVFSFVFFNLGMAEVLLTPLVLSFGSPAQLGVVMTAGGVGMLGGSVLMSVWGGPRALMAGMLGLFPVQGAMFLLGGLTPSALVAATGVFGFSFVFPIILGCNNSLWQRKTPLAFQGRVFALRDMVDSLLTPLGYLVAGPLADRVFEPLLMPGGALASSVGAVIGVGPGRGVGFLFILLGLNTFIAAAVGLLHPRVRRLEQELPDALHDEAVGGPARPEDSRRGAEPHVVQEQRAVAVQPQADARES